MAQILDNNNNSMELEIEEEAAVLRDIQNKMTEKMDLGKVMPPSLEEQKVIDARSVFVGNVNFNATINEVKEHFKGCGEIVRVTIPKDKFTLKQKNFAYIEFGCVEEIENALLMHGTLFLERPIVVTAKRTNVPGRGTSRGGRGRGAFRGGRGGQQTVVVKYVYVNGAAPRADSEDGSIRIRMSHFVR